MNKHLCEDCLPKENKLGVKMKGPIPVFMVLGGLSVLPINFVLVPIGMFFGALVDAIVCDKCGSSKNVFEVMIESKDRKGRKIYRPIPPPRAENPQFENPVYEFDEIEGKFNIIEDPALYLDTPELDLSDTAFQNDYQVTFDSDSFEMDLGNDFGEIGNGDFGSDFGGDGGDFGGDSGSGFGGGEGK